MSETINSCLICNSKNIISLKNYEKDHLFQCKTCGFVFANKKPTIKELIDEYNKYERGYIISDITIKRYQEILDIFEKYRITNKIIDVGAGDGHFLEQAKKRGWETYATEFDENAIKVIKEKGIKTYTGKLEPNDFKPEMFDIIFSSEVLEHINDPQDEIRKFQQILRKGGIVYITTPNFNSISHKILKEKWTVFNYPEHLSYYTPKTIKLLFKNNGFKKIKISTTGLSPDRYFASKGVREKNITTEDVRKKTETKLIWRFIKSSINIILNTFKIGDTIKSTFIKL